MRSFLSNLFGILLLGLLFAIGCGGVFIDAPAADRAINDWMGR